METQDHRNASPSGHEGHVGVHICHGCGWPFPNPHPSSRHRRAHKRVCGTIEGYRLDHAQDETHLDGSDGEHVSDDGPKNPSDNVVERTLSRRSSNGVGSRSSRSTRSEDEVFADAVTDFVDSPGTKEGYGVISRGNSLQNITENEPKGTHLVVENATADNLSTSNILFEGKELQPVKTTEGENDEGEASVLSHDHITSSSNNLDTSIEEGKEIVPALRGLSEELLDSSSEIVDPPGMQTTGFEDKVESFHGVDSPENFHASVHSVQVVEAPDMVKEHGSRTVPDALSLQETHEIITVEDLDHKGWKFNNSMALDATLAVEGVKFSKAHAFELDQTSDVKASNAGINEFRSEVLEDIKSESLKDQKVTNAHESNDLGYDEKVRVEGTKAPGCELTKAGCDGQTVMVGVREIQNLDKMAVGECISIDNMADVGKSDDCSDSILKMSGDAGSCFPSSVAATDGCMEKSVDNAAGIAEVDRITEQEQHATVSAVDIVDSRSQSESLEGNCGSVSVLPAVLEASTASDMAASKKSQASASGEAGTVGLEPISVGEDHNTESKTSVEAWVEPARMEGAPEIQASLNQQHPSLSADVANEPLGGKRNEDITIKQEQNALKTLLGEAIAKSREESPNLDSPARSPVNIKTEKRRGKSRPYWVPFLCCSSVNAR